MNQSSPNKKASTTGHSITEESYVTSKLFKIANLSLSLVIVGIVFVLVHFNVLKRIELTTLDLRFKLRGRIPTSDNIILVDIDESSISAIGRWPWSREWYASLITTLTEYKSKTIAFDIFFSEPTPLTDFFLIEAARVAKNVLLALAFEYSKPLSPIPPETQIVLEKFSIPETAIIGNKNNIPKLGRPVPPLVQLYDEVHGAGHVVIDADEDGIIRHAPSVINCNDKYYLHFAIISAIDFLELDPSKVKIVLGRYLDLGKTSNGHIRIPIDQKGIFLVNWASQWGRGFRHFSYWSVVSSYQRQLKGLESYIDLNQLKDKICLIGLTAIGLIDIKPIPLEPAYPVVGLHANIINSIIKNDFIIEVQDPLNLLIVLFLTIIIGVIVPKFRPIGGAFFTLGIISTYCLVAFLVFKFFGFWINIVYPLTASLLSASIITIHSEVANAIERSRLYNLAIEDGLTKLFVVRHFKETLSKEMAKASRYNKQLSIIISDIDHFKRVNDTYGHLAGDFILRETANIFRSSCREADIAGRYGGEEFIILLPETNREGAVEFAERLRLLISGLTLEYNNTKFNITISFGVAEFKNDNTPEEFIKRADEALYVAKETGRNKVCFS